MAAALIYYYMGPYMVTALRGASSHFTIAGNTMCKLFQSDEDEEVCDGRQLAADVCAGIRDCVWCDTFLTVVPGPDDTATLNARGGARLADLRNAQAYYTERLSKSGHATQYIVRLLPAAMLRAKTYPCLSEIFQGTTTGNTIIETAIEIAAALNMTGVKQVDDMSLAAIESALSPLTPQPVVSACFTTKLSVTTARCRNDKHFMSELQNSARSSRRSHGRRRTHRTRALHR